jgi:outer membrane receptor protein involved in Fe transport
VTRPPLLGLACAVLAAAARAEEPPPPYEVVVTATRSPAPLRDATSVVTVLSRDRIERSPAKTPDELLRVVPSFALFRRSSSLVSDPTAQGVNLRGIGPSGVSRSLVLVDGLPANDPFGGWVYWRGISLLDVDRIEVAPGGGSALYGNYALGGVTQVLTRPIRAASADVLAEYGSFDTYRLGARAAGRWGRLAAAADAELLDSGGYAVIAPAARGPIDGAAPSEHLAANVRLEAQATRALSLRLRGGLFGEDQHGGTGFTTAAVRRLGWAGGARWAPGRAGVLDLSVFGHAPRLEQDRARITAAPRASAALAASQRVPARDLGAGLAWTSPPLRMGGTHTVTVGADVRRITASVTEDLFPATVAEATVVGREAHGEQRLYGAFAQDVCDLGDALSLSLALRYDRWQDVNAWRVERLGSGARQAAAFPDRGDRQLSPRLGVRVDPLDGLTLRASAYRAFRAPTLNELYRPFQAGLVLTDANADLGPEQLRGVEAGIDLAPARAATIRVTGFWNELQDPIVNASCAPGSASAASCRQVGPNLAMRQNLGRARIRGLEAEAGLRVRRAWRAGAAYTLVDGRVTDARGQEQLGRELPQSPRHRGSLSLAFDRPRLGSALVQVRYLGRQFEDDLNTRPMAAALLVDLSASRRVGANVDVVLAVENLFDREYLVGRAGVDTVGQPRFVHGGLRAHLGER